MALSKLMACGSFDRTYIASALTKPILLNALSITFM